MLFGLRRKNPRASPDLRRDKQKRSGRTPRESDGTNPPKAQRRAQSSNVKGSKRPIDVTVTVVARGIVYKLPRRVTRLRHHPLQGHRKRRGSPQGRTYALAQHCERHTNKHSPSALRPCIEIAHGPDVPTSPHTRVSQGGLSARSQPTGPTPLTRPKGYTNIKARASSMRAAASKVGQGGGD